MSPNIQWDLFRNLKSLKPVNPRSEFLHTIKGNGHGGVRYPRGFGVLTAAQKKNILLVLEAKQLCILEGG